MRDAPGEPLTFVFTDLESSTRLWERFADAMKGAMERHDEILRDAVNGAGGRVVKITGDGLMAVFGSPSAAAAAALEAQRALQREPWGETGPLRVRMGIHVGVAQQRAADFYGPPVNRTARIMAAAHGGQVLLSADAARLADQLPAHAGLRDLGEHRLKDLAQPEHIFQLTHPKLVSDLPPLATLSDRPNNLPTQTSEFLGREIQLSAIRDLLDAHRVRLLTLTGPGGIGKTRLALQAAANQIDRFEHGVYFVDLSPVRDRDAAFQAVVRAVGVSASTDEPPQTVLKQALRSRQLLLVLDNFEQVMEAVDGVTDLLQHCPELKALVTSREALRVRGEHLFPVPPLALPDGGETAAEPLAEYDAIRLFVERAREVQPGFALTDENAAAVAEICARLDGLPLAIELAAARLTLFSPDELGGRLDRRLDVLRGGPRDLPARQQTLRSMIEWSHDLLRDDERPVFRLLSVFVTARLEAIEAVAAGLEPLRGIDVVERLASLVDKSLVRSMEEGGQRRLSMLETIREYAAERLDDDPDLASAAPRAHAEYFCEFTRSRRHLLYGPEREAVLDELGAELGNLLAAWWYWVDEREPERLNSLLDGLWVLNEDRGWYHATIELANDLLGVLSAVPSTPARLQEEIALRTSLARGLLAIRGYTEEAEATYDRALALAEQTGHLPQRAPVVRSLASFYFYRGEFDRAAALGRELLDLAEERGDATLQVDAELVYGASVAFLGEVVGGMEHIERAVALFDPRQHLEGFRFGPSPGAIAYTTSALLQWLRGRPDRATERSERAIELAPELDHPYSTAYIFFHTAVLDLWRRRLAIVHERAGVVLDVAEEQGYQIWKAVALIVQGAAAAGLGRPDEGVASMERGVELYQGLTTPAVFWPLVLSTRARGFGHAGRPEDGLRLIEEALQIVGTEAFLHPEFSLVQAELVHGLGDTEAAVAALRGAVDSGRRLGLHMPELRAATRLVRLRQGDAVEQLRRVYESFTEGFDDPDLVDARAALAELDVPVVWGRLS
jgi:predicted ATPase/class 3 adenylate cyclase